MKKLFIPLFCLLSFIRTSAQEVDSLQLYLDNIEAQLNYQTGKIELSNGIGSITVPEGFLFLAAKDAQYVLQEVWGNPADDQVLGMLVPENAKVTTAEGWAFIVTYDEMGYVKDDDADEIDYQELLGEMRTDTEAGNPSRTKAGFDPISLVGWASAPFYDKEKKVLHWAKELKFGESEENTLNYNVRILGRKGVLVLNAVSMMHQLPEVKEQIAPVMASFSFSEGNAYSDFNPEIDEVAAWTIGGLVAGKVLAKAGFFALFLKYIKFIGIALMGVGGAAWRWWKRRTEPATVRTIAGEDSPKS